ncbi:Nitroreductase [Chitinophaga terrae (ex Kim and Jung 2007)]|uniref:Nitroreductase n=1 Tax=Chitinophaga terrae (ex Kim and Jung 2007) TaxID=408074 RepID=A0A1H4CNG4_9BACT|nr:NAD(P)H-dependent oxidoreductase [Chitinophaga terrae (ex Kim and Jung 2007)]GEP90346.1 NAD(P)H-dependent oxidoreductase [Chitinophaga terrae (ex Kim and Jung 2007)]SEA61860.1 Nitroreductase [Chitinophaga terrae (ex Kim and Jung 2007)]
MNIIEKLEWRYAVKKFDPTRKLTAEQLNRLLAATRLSASSYGLQPYKILVIEDPEVREKLKAASNNQSQITDASQLLVFARHTDLGNKHVDAYMQNIANTRNIPLESLAGFSGMMKQVVGQLDETGTAVWTSKQAYLALGTLLAAAAVEGIDTCPMEGFNAAQYDDILELKEKGLSAVVIAAIGFRASDDKMQHARKVRKSLDDLVEII